jgi:uncharacterized protein (DUF1697 family)
MSIREKSRRNDGMATWVALLRGVGGGIRPLSMRELTAALEGIGLRDVFSSTKSATRLAGEIESCIEQKFGFHSKTFIVSVPELQRAAKGNPFPQADEKPQALHLFFLAKPARVANLDAMNELKTKTEQFVLKGKVFYFYTPDGFGISKLAAKAERLLGVDTTARNWRTVGKLLELAKG